MGRIILIRRADVGDFENHITAAILLPKTDTHVLLAEPTEIGVFEKVRMDGDFGTGEGIVGDTARGLIGVIHATVLDPDIRVLVWSVELAGGEELHVAMIEAVKGQIDLTGTIDVGNRGRVVLGWFGGQLLNALMEERRGRRLWDTLSAASWGARHDSSAMGKGSR